jgi:DNA repair exonuclease SbcCD ATPase subunit
VISERARPVAREIKGVPATVTLSEDVERFRRELETLNERVDAAWERREQLANRDLPAAQAEDQQEYAKTLREGVTAPKKRRADVVQAKVDAASLELEGLRTALDQASADLLAALEAFAASGGLEELRAQRDAAHAAYCTLVEQLAPARSLATTLDAAVAWVERVGNGSEDLRLQNVIPPVPLRSVAGDHTPFAAIHAALERDLAPLPTRPAIDLTQLVA